MDCLKLVGLLVMISSIQISAEGPKKKIRIHLPHKVKHIHHHKKIYITNHPAPSQYAPALLPEVPGVKGGVALPTNLLRPAVANLLPFNSVEHLFEEDHPRLSHILQATSKLLPLYRVRGHYGPNSNQADYDQQDYVIESQQDQRDVYGPPGYSAPDQTTASASVPNPPKTVKIVNEIPRKKIFRKVKPKRVIIGGKPTLPRPLFQEEHPVSTFHEQFYSDLEDAGTITKIRKPPRIEKIIDGNTEHIHTYSEEHIHKIVFDDDSKVTGVVGVNPIGSISTFSASHPLIPIKNIQSLIANPTSNFDNLAIVGSMGTPSHMEYAAYNPRDVTHDHIFHDHGEIPPNIEVTQETLRQPPKVSYNSHGLPISTSNKHPLKHRAHDKPIKATHDFSYYENFYNTPSLIPKKIYKSTNPYGISSEVGTIKDFRSVPTIRFKDAEKNNKGWPHGKIISHFPLQHANLPSPFALSTSVIHDHDSKNFNMMGPAPTAYTKFRDSVGEFKKGYGSDFDYDTYAASSNIHTYEDKNDSTMTYHPRGKKSMSTQNIRFGEQDHKKFVDHIGSSSISTAAISDEVPKTMDNFEDSTDSIFPTSYGNRETSRVHPHYQAMAIEALYGDQSKALNNNAQYPDPPNTTAAATEPALVTTTQPPLKFYTIQSTDDITPETDFLQKQHKSRREKGKHHHRQRFIVADFRNEYSSPSTVRNSVRHEYQHQNDSDVRGSLKYGDKL